MSMLPLFKKSHIHSRHIEDLLKTGSIRNYAVENNKRNALRQASFLYRIIDGELFRHGTEREYNKYGLRLVVHDDQPDKKAEIIARCHLDNAGGHLGMNNTIKNVCDTYYWQGISAHVKMYLKQCEQCKARSKFNAEEWLELERKNIDKKKAQAQVMNEAQQEIKNLGRVKKPTPPETFFIVNAERKIDFESAQQDGGMMIDSNNIEYVVETLGQSDGYDLDEVCHVLNVPDIVPIPERFRSREIENFLKDGTYPDDFTSNMKCGLRGPAAQYTIIDGELYHEGNKAGSKGMRLVIHDDLPALKVKVMVECHIDEEGSHHGLNKTLNKIGEKYHWVGMSVDVRKFMMHCNICTEQRGRKALFDDNQYEQEAHEVKSRHLKKMNETEASGSGMELTAVPVSYDSTNIEPTEGLEQEGHQVIRLIGPNKEVTEITVAVVNQETVSADGIEPNQIIQESEKDSELQIVTKETGKGRSLVTKEMTDAVAQIEAAEAAMEMAANRKQEDIKAEEEMEDKAKDETRDTSSKSEEILSMKNEADEDLESGNMDPQDEQTCSAEKSEEVETVEPEGEMAQMETEDGIVNVLIIKDGEKNQEEAQEVVTIVEGDEHVEAVESGSMVVLASGEEHTLQENDSGMNSVSGLCSYYKDVVYVPELKKTRIIENFLKLGAGAEGFTHSKLLEMSENFEIVDDVLYRRPSRYKGRQIVIHDDIPELKYKLIAEMHLKRNGQHCSELITFQNVSFKYSWEEMKWDVHRWYPTCNICVNESGIERKSNKRLLTVPEQKRHLEEKRRENRVSGANAVRSRDFRKRFSEQFGKFMIMEKYGKDHWEDALKNIKSHAQLLQVSESEIKKAAGTRNNVMVTVEGSGTNEDSDVEIHIPESEDEVNPQDQKARKKAHVTALYDLVVYATLEQEQSIKAMYAKKHWSYKPVSFTKAADDMSNDDDEDYYLVTLIVTAFQENAIKELFQTMGLAIEASEEPKPDSIEQVQSPGQHVQNINPDLEETEPETDEQYIVIESQEPENMEDNSVKRQGTILKTRESSAQTQELVFQEEETVPKKEKMRKETTKSTMQELQKQELQKQELQKQELQKQELQKQELQKQELQKQELQKQELQKQELQKQELQKQELQKHVKESVLPKQKVVLASVKVKSDLRQTISSPNPKPSEGRPTTTSPDPKLSSVKVPVVRSVTKKVVEKVESPVPPVTQAATPKRKISSIQSPDTPVSETRRSRREIKRPRRFSPDSSPQRTVQVKIEPVSQDSDSQDDIEEIELQKQEIGCKPTTRVNQSSTNTKVVSSPKKTSEDTPKIGTVRSTRSSQTLPKTNDARNLRSRNETEKERNKMVVMDTKTNNTEGLEDKQKARVSVMSKGRIRVRKIPIEINSHSQTKADSNSSESNVGDVEMAEKSSGDLTEDNKEKDQEVMEEETVVEDHEDSDDDDDDDEYDDNDDDDYMDITDETEDMKVPLHIVLEDTLDSMEAIEVDSGYVCSLCNVKFKNKNLCIQHGQKKICYKECELCGKMFKKKDTEQYKIHAELHKNDQKYSCSDCEKVFFSDEHLKIHTQSHKNEIVTKCSRCREAFNTWFLYASHMVHKHGECNMFTCDVCSAKFANISYLKSENLTSFEDVSQHSGLPLKVKDRLL